MSKSLAKQINHANDSLDYIKEVGLRHLVEVNMTPEEYKEDAERREKIKKLLRKMK